MRMREDHWRMRRSWMALSLCALAALLVLFFTQQLWMRYVITAAFVGLCWEVVAWYRLRGRMEPFPTSTGTVYRVGSSLHGPRLWKEFFDVLWVSLAHADAFPVYYLVMIAGIAALLTALCSLFSHDFFARVWSSGVGLCLGVLIPRLFHILWFESTYGPLYRYMFPSATGAESLPGTTGMVFRRLTPRGTVKIHGVFWNALSVDGHPIEEGSDVIVERIEGLTLHVSRWEASPSGTRR
jgi:membrane protein implicated in regulation of membrane protease activity